MPPLTRWMIKTSLVYLLLALTAGLAQGAESAGLTGLGFLRSLGPIRVHMLVVGLVLQLIFGVVYWMFPRYNRERLRGFEWLGWATYALLNIGLLLRVFSEGSARPGTPAGWMLVASALLQWLAGLAFVINTWPRIRVK